GHSERAAGAAADGLRARGRLARLRAGEDGDADAPARRYTGVALTRVLVVDDEAALRDALGYALRQEGFEVELRTDGDSGLTAALEDDVDLVILDLMLPGLTGTEVCRRLRAESPVPIIMLTAKGAEVGRVL